MSEMLATIASIIVSAVVVFFLIPGIFMAGTFWMNFLSRADEPFTWNTGPETRRRGSGQ